MDSINWLCGLPSSKLFYVKLENYKACCSGEYFKRVNFGGNGNTFIHGIKLFKFAVLMSLTFATITRRGGQKSKKAKRVDHLL